MKTMTTMKSAAAAVVMSVALMGCLPLEGGEVGKGGEESPQAEQFRKALVSAEDVQMTYGESSGVRVQGLNGEYSAVAAMTAEAVVGTSAFLVEHFQMMERITDLPPTEVDEDRAAWRGEHKDLRIEVIVERSDVPRGTRFDYRMQAAPAADPGAELLPLVDGHVVRIETRPAEWGDQGFGIVRFYFDNLNTLQPEREVGGKARVAFRRVGEVRQVRTHLLDITSPEDPNFPPRARYGFTLLPEDAGGLRWFSRSDANKDGDPNLETVAVHSAWRKDRSGMGNAFVTGGSLEVDYWNLTECWDRGGLRSFGRLSTPDGALEQGKLANCFGSPEELEAPTVDENFADEDPAIPAEHPDE